MYFKRSHELGLEEARRRADKVAEHLQEEFSLRSEWQGDKLQVKGSGLDGYLAVSDDAIEIKVKLGLALMLMEQPIRTAIDQTLDEHLV